MLKKKVLLYGKTEGLCNFFDSFCNKEYEPVAIVSADAKMLKIISHGNSPRLEVFSPESLPNFVYGMADGILLVDKEKRQDSAEFLLGRGVEPKKIISWNTQGQVEASAMKIPDGSVCAFAEGLEFHLRDEEDKNFLRQICSQLQMQKAFSTYPPGYYRGLFENTFRSATGRTLRWDNPQTWTEKIQRLKFFDSSPLKIHLADKYSARHFVEEKIGGEYLIPLYGVWKNFDEMMGDFDFLPEKFVLKCNHAPNMSVTVEKKSLNVEKLRERFNAWQQVDYGAQPTMELYYRGIRRRIFAEKFFEEKPSEYKFFCFGGEPSYCLHENIFFDMDWDSPFEETPAIPKPKNFHLLKKLAKKLCGEFSFVSVGFKVFDGEIYFDEFDFSPGAGFTKFKSEEIDKHFGDLLNVNSPPPAVQIPAYEPSDYAGRKYSVRLRFAHKEKIIFPEVEPKDRRVIASLTSWTKRISTAHMAVETILAQTRQPDLTVLYLAEEEFPNREGDLPPQLTSLLSEKFEIHWTKNLGSYKKLIPALKEFPEDPIVTFDDDILYPSGLVERFLEGYKKFPSCMQFHWGGASFFDGERKISNRFVYYDYPTHLQGAWGSGGILYPPHSFGEEIFDEEVFMRFFHNQDDNWIGIHLLLNGVRANFVEYGDGNFGHIPGVQEFAIHRAGGLEGVPAAAHEDMKKYTKEHYPQLDEILWREWLMAK